MFADSSEEGIFLSKMHAGVKWKLAPVIISGHLYIFWALLFSERFYFSSAFISRALFFLERFHFSSAFISRALSFLERFYVFLERFHFSSAFIFLPSAFILWAPLFFVFQMWVSAYLFSLSVSQRTFIFSFQEHCSAPALISGREALKFLDHSLIIFIIILNMFQYQH